VTAIEDLHKFQIDTDEDSSSSDEEKERRAKERKQKKRWIDWGRFWDRIMLKAHAKKFELDEKRINRANEKDEAHHFAKLSS
jgi:hypothetical protein